MTISAFANSYRLRSTHSVSSKTSRLTKTGLPWLLAAYGAGNPYAAAMITLNDSAPSGTEIAANLAVLGQVAAAAAADAAAGTNSVSALIVSHAVGAVTAVSGFVATDAANVGAATPLSNSSRVRAVVDLYAVLLMGAVQSQFGTSITAYQSAAGNTALSAENLAGILANRINAAPAGGSVQELKEWTALLSYEGTALGGSIGLEYESTGNFAQFGSFGAAVKIRNAMYPVTGIGQLLQTLGALSAAP